MAKKHKKNVPTNQKKGTLDQKHTEKIEMLEKISSSLPDKREQLIQFQNELDNLISKDPNKYTHENIRRKSYLMDLIEKLKDEIKYIENGTESLNYIVKTLPILVDYYDNDGIIEDNEELINDECDTGKKNIISYFMMETSKKQPEINNDKNESGIKKNINRAKLYDNYLNVINTNYQKNNNEKNNICAIPDCGGEWILSHIDGYMICQKCGCTEAVMLSNEKVNYKEPTQDSGTYAYKRINHLTEILSQLQAKESTDIPSKVFEGILKELKKRKIDKNELDIFRLRRILKKLNYRKYYEHVPHILQVINGKEPPNFSRSDEMKIKKMFKDIQEPFALYCPKNRKNFLNYSYVLHKFCELLDLDEYVTYFPLLKNNAKLLQHDRIWKNICNYMRWEYIKSI